MPACSPSRPGVRCSLFLALALALLPPAVARAGLQNPSFELGSFSPGVPNYVIVPEVQVPGWRTTASDHRIEVWSDGYGSFASFQGKQHIELNANEVASVYQDAPGIPAGAIMGFRFAHRGRLGDDTMEMRITDPGPDGDFATAGDNSVLFSKQYTTGTSGWALYTGATEPPIYSFGRTVRFEFISVSATGGDPRIGNFIDAADFGVGVGESCPDSMVLHLPFDLPQHPGADASGNGLDGVLEAAIPVPGHCGNALLFLPDNNVPEFSVPSSSLLNITGEMSASAWVRVLGVQSTDGNPGCTEGTIFCKGGTYWFQVEKLNDRLVFQNEPSGSEVAIADVGIPVGVWTQVGFVRGPWTASGQSFQFYVNGEPVPTTILHNGQPVPLLLNQGYANPEPFMVGNYGFGNSVSTCEFNGDIDDLRVFSRALTPQQMLAVSVCPCAEPTPCNPLPELVLNTGWNQALGTELADGVHDNEWTVVTDPMYSSTLGSSIVPRPAVAVPVNLNDPYNPAWPAPLPNSHWIGASSVDRTQLDFGNPAFTVLEYRFCLPDSFNVNIAFTARSFRNARVLLNGNFIGYVSEETSWPGKPPKAISSTVSSYFRTGRNVLTVSIEHSWAEIGFDLAGSIYAGSALGHACCSDSSAAIMGTKWNDLDRDGSHDSNEPGLPGWTIHLSNGRSVVTDALGQYCFMDLLPGNYLVTESPQAGWTQTYPGTGLHQVTLAPGGITEGVDFGNGNFSDLGGVLRGGDWYHDAFPFNEDPALPGTALFDTTTALVKTGRNISPPTGDLSRLDIPGDSLTACACGDSVRLDLVFRILPGPGNYRAEPGRQNPPTTSMVLLADPRAQGVAAIPGDGSFWGQYMADPGAYGTIDGHHNGTLWDPNTWNSARMDSAEVNLFPVSRAGNLPRLGGCIWSGTYHELDPKYSTLGIERFRCFVIDTTLVPPNGDTPSNVICDGTVPYYLSGSPSSYTGFNGQVTTKEYTKIIPDGLLTPGSHVEYFIRRSNVANSAVYTLMPDTNRVTPQYGERSADGDACTPNGEGGLDAHRWQQFGVLPDRWKSVTFGGHGMACMLYVDLADGHGDEAAWVAASEQLGATRSDRLGSHNGWHAPRLDSDPNDPANFVRTHGGNAGSSWDMYAVRAADDLVSGYAGSLGSRYAAQPAAGPAVGKTARIGPTMEMLRQYYPLVWLSSAELSTGILGPFPDRSQNDLALIDDFLLNPAGPFHRPRGLYISGSGFVQSEAEASQHSSAHLAFMTGKLGVVLAYPDLHSLNTEPCPDLLETTALSTGPDIFGVRNDATRSLETTQRNPAIPEMVLAAQFEGHTSFGPYPAAWLHPHVVSRLWISLVEGFGIQDVVNRECVNQNGRLSHLDHVFGRVFGALCDPTSSSGGTTSVPEPPSLENGLRVRVNPAIMGRTSLRLSLAHADRCELAVYDVSGRRTRLLVDGAMTAGVHDVAWDGRDESGARMAAGVYFVRVRLLGSGFTESRTLVIVR